MLACGQVTPPPNNGNNDKPVSDSQNQNDAHDTSVDVNADGTNENRRNYEDLVQDPNLELALKNALDEITGLLSPEELKQLMNKESEQVPDINPNPTPATPTDLPTDPMTILDDDMESHIKTTWFE